jgi:hypothetical protein
MMGISTMPRDSLCCFGSLRVLLYICNIVCLCVLDSFARLCVFFCFMGLMDISSRIEEQIVHDTTEVVGNNGALPSMMALHDVLRDIEEMLAPLKCYIEASEAGMAQALSFVQTTHANVPVGNAKEPKFIMPEKFDGTRSKFCGFVQQVNLFLRLHPSCYPDDSMQVAFIGSLLSGNVFSWFAPFLEKHSPVLQDMVQFEAFFIVAFGDSDRERVVETKMQSLCQGICFAPLYATEFINLHVILSEMTKLLSTVFDMA